MPKIKKTFFHDIRVRSTKRYGWRPQHPDHRDVKYAMVRNLLASPLPPSADMRQNKDMPGVYDQGQIGSCTANAISCAVEFEQRKQNLRDFLPSRLFIYYNERALEGTVNQDAGAVIRDGFKVIASLGVCEEKWWKYNTGSFAMKPPAKAYSQAVRHKALNYFSLNHTDITQLKACLSDGFPFVFGFGVPESFESAEVARTGILNMPGPNEKLVGGHAVICVGYDDKLQRFIVRNSWGPDWGQAGYFTMPYAFMTGGLCDDFWTLRLVLANNPQ